MASSAWTLEQSKAALQLEALQATTDVHSLAAGLTHLCVDGKPLEGSLWKIADASNKLTEAFVRGNDLVARYQGAKPCPFRTTVYWSAERAKAGGATVDQLSLTISVDTDLLDSQPEVKVSTQLLAEEVLCVRCPVGEDPIAQTIAQGTKRSSSKNETSNNETEKLLVLYRLPGGKLSWAEMLHPDALQQFEQSQEPKVNWPKDGMASVEWHLFGQFLEKGVIRQARMNAALLPRKNDVATAAKVFQQFAQSEAVLTT